MRRALVVVLVALAACQSPAPTSLPSPTPLVTSSASPTLQSTASDAPTPTPTLGQMVADSAAGWTFDRPTDWAVSLPAGYDPLQGGVSVFLSNFPLRPECLAAAGAGPTPSPSPSPACLVPFATIPDGGVYLEIYGSRTASQVPSRGEQVTVLGRPSRLEIDRPGRCATQVTDEVLKVPVPDGGGGGVYHVSVIACLVGPDVEQSEREFRAFLASLSEQ